jgi:Putative polyhydroxyalkanoic acid system protein (PHA_gran_rgn)
MSKPFMVSIPHSLGKDEAVRRIKDGVHWATTQYGSMVSISANDWKDDQLAFRVGALGQTAEGIVAVTDTDATVTVQLPWLLAKFAGKVQAVLQQQGPLLLAKK